MPAERGTENIRRLIDETPEIEPHSSGTSDTAFPPTPYLAPPLTLLPKVLKDYVRSAAESLNVDVAYILLPLLSSLGSATGNSRSILLKPGFIQPPVIWTGIVGRSGSRKSPALEAGCFAVMEHERELMQENRSAQTDSEARLGEWESKSKKDRGIKPDSPPLLTCVLDDLTIEVLTDVHVGNPRGVLVRKDELSHWVASFDQYRSSKGSDVARWLSLHTAVFLAVDRRTDNRHHRISLPRVCITGGIQPQILRRVLTQEFFERGLPARFLFGYPPFIPDKWTEATIPNRVRADALDLFNKLWLLQPDHDDRGEPSPKLLRLDAEAKAVFVEFYNECGAVTLEASEHEEAAWCKLTGYATRLALVGQLARDPNAVTVTGDTMRAACDLARWFGNEATRIYAELAETREQREQRELCEFIERHGGAVYEREVIQSFTRLKNDKPGVERELIALIKAGRGKWEPVDHGGGPGRPARKFRLVRLSTSTQFGISRGESGNSVDVDAANSQKITTRDEPENGAVPEDAGWPEGAEIRDGKVIL